MTNERILELAKAAITNEEKLQVSWVTFNGSNPEIGRYIIVAEFEDGNQATYEIFVNETKIISFKTLEAMTQW